MIKLFAALSFSLLLQGCLAVSAVRATGDIAEGAVNATVLTSKTAGKAAGTVIPDGNEDE